ncbi:phosphotransferase [Pseudooceanicola sp.]|uniref:aminoglycoside phosphotransferase family protein n=1 Tax=Pseudooceanicola sp. TaxID=1914328 RepID=UPI002613D969|nr:phosphotransferase [Pseudooceanicola sp.]MDF1854933.1 phosphotransferase [Pseudooceanicola sp.]
MERSELCDRFLAASDLSGATRVPVSGDASNRRYERIVAPGGPVILMDAPPEKGEDVRPFVEIANHLRGLGLSAPKVLAAETETGFLLLEDLGDDLFARLLAPGVAVDDTDENRLYTAATDLLLMLRDAPLPPGIGGYDPAQMAELAALMFDWYLAAPQPEARQTFVAAMGDALTEHSGDTSVLVLRDYHAENLIWLPDRTAEARVGLLDFQDALAGHPAYDLVSLVQDARRDVSPALEPELIRHYCRASHTDQAEFEAAYFLLGAQRNLRILGVFARLCLRDSKPHYLDLMPRVWAHLVRDLAHPALADVAALLTPILPAPTPARLAQLRSLCGTRPTA